MMRRRQPVARVRGGHSKLLVDRLYRFEFENDTYRPAVVVARVDSSVEHDVLTVLRVESYVADDPRQVIPIETVLTLNPGQVTGAMIINDESY